GTARVQWQLGDPARADAIATALDAQPTSDVAVGPHGENIHRILWHGAISPYTLFQFTNIQSTHQGTGGDSTNNGTVSSTFCSWAYANGGPPMTTYRYGRTETINAANNFFNFTYNQCMANLPWVIKTFGNNIGALFGCSQSTVCNNVANMVL